MDIFNVLNGKFSKMFWDKAESPHSQNTQWI